MAERIGFNDVAQLSDRETQIFLRAVDSKVLAAAMKGCRKAVKDRIFRNVSRRVGILIEDETRRLDRSKSKPAREFCGALLLRLVDKGEVEWPPGAERKARKPLPKGYAKAKRETVRAAAIPIDSMTCEEVNALLMGVARIARTEGVLALEPLIEVVPDTLVESALRLIVDGTEPSLIRDVLTSLCESLVREFEVKQKKVVEGLLATQAGRHPVMIEQQLNAIY